MADFSQLKAILSGNIILQSENEKAYQQEVDETWNAAIRERKPAAFVRVATVEDVANTVKYCVQNELEMCVCAAKNSDFALADDAVVIDLSDLNTVTVDVEGKVAVVGAGAKLSDVDKETARHSLVTPLGSYSELGVAGFTLLGGTGFLSRSYGCTADNILEFELVTASGDVIKASEDENQELFWGMKGYGSNFGVVTSMKFQLYDIPDNIIGGDLYYPVSKAPDAFKITRDLIREKADNRLSVYMMVHYKCSGPQVLCRFLFIGPPKEGGVLLMELTSLTKPLVNKVKPIPFDEFQKSGDWLITRGCVYYATMGTFVRELTDEAIDIIFDGVNQAPEPGVIEDSNIYLTSLGGKVKKIPAESSPYPFRQAEYWVGIVSAIHGSDSHDAVKSWVDNIDKRLSKYGIFPQGEEAEKEQDRLKQLKLKYDPENIFHQNINIDIKKG